MVRTLFGFSSVCIAAVLAASLLGCGANVSGTGSTGGNGGNGGNGGGSTCSAADHCAPTCPATRPTDGAACPLEGMECEYHDVPGCDEAFADATCTGGVWSVTQGGPACLGTCMSTTPTLGATCSSCCVAAGCKYFDSAGCVVEITCTGVWTAGPASCPAPSPCAKHGQQADCQADTACRWLVGSTCPENEGPPPPFPQGCYPAADCATDADCTGGATCQQVDVDPCPGGDCSACKKAVHICVP